MAFGQTRVVHPIPGAALRWPQATVRGWLSAIGGPAQGQPLISSWSRKSSPFIGQSSLIPTGCGPETDAADGFYRRKQRKLR